MSRFKLLALFLSAVVLCCRAEEKEPVTKIEVRVMSYAGADATQKENRLFIFGNHAYRTIGELTKVLADRPRDLPPLYLVAYGTCIVGTPRFQPEELQALKEACKKAGISFKYYPAG